MYIFDISIKSPNVNFDVTKNQTPLNLPWNSIKLPMEQFNSKVSTQPIYFSECIWTTKHTINTTSYSNLKELFDRDVADIETNCPFGTIVNPDGNGVAEGIVYTATLPAVSASEYCGPKEVCDTKFKVKGTLHKRKPGHTLTGVDNAPLNDWALESDALSNDRLMQMFDAIHKDVGFVTGMNGEFLTSVLNDIEKECYVFLDNPEYCNITPFLIRTALRKPIAKWYRNQFEETFTKEISELAELHRIPSTETKV